MLGEYNWYRLCCLGCNHIGLNILIPTKMIKLIESHCRSYLWLGFATITKRALVAWEKICTPKSARGMNLTNIRLWNRAAIAKTNWDLTHKQDKLWIKWIYTYYIKKGLISIINIPTQASWMIRKIIVARETLNQIQMNTLMCIRDIYRRIIGEKPRVTWKTLMFKMRPDQKQYSYYGYKCKISWWQQISLIIGGLTSTKPVSYANNNKNLEITYMCTAPSLIPCGEGSWDG